MSSFFKKHIDILLLLFIIIIAVVLRTYRISLIPFTHDEFSAIFRTQFSSFKDLIEHGVKVDGHPPLIQVFLYYWIKIFGVSELWIKLPFILSGITAVFLSYKIGKDWFNSTTGLLVALLIAILEYPVLYSQIARPYITGLFLVLLFVYFWNKIIFHSEKKRWYYILGYAVSGALASYDHHFALLQVAIIGLSGLFFINKSNIKHYFISNIILVILYLPNLSVFFAQLHLKGIEGWLSKPDHYFIFDYLYYTINFSGILGITLGVFLLLGFLFKSETSSLKTKFIFISILWFILPFLVGFFYSIFINSVLQFSVLIFAFPFILLFFFGFIRNGSVWFKLSSILLISIIGIYSLISERNHYQVFYQSPYEKIIENSITITDSLGSENCLTVLSLSLTDTNCTPAKACFYYINKSDIKNKLKYLSVDSISDYEILNDFLRNFEGNFVYYGYLSHANPEIYPLIKRYFPNVYQKFNFSGGDGVIFTKNKTDNLFNEKYSSVLSFENKINYWDAYSDILLDSNSTDGQYSYRFDSLSEWGPAYSDTLFRIAKKTDFIDISLDVFPLGNFSNALIVSTLDDDTINIDWRSTPFSIFNLIPNSWSTVTHSIKLPDIIKNAVNPRLKIFIWNNEKQNFLVDNVKISVRRGNPRLYWLVTKEVKTD